MIKEYRSAFNAQFSKSRYDSFLNDITSQFNHIPDFRIAETPVFIPQLLKERIVEASEEILAFINRPNFKELTKDAIKHPSLQVPYEDYQSRFIQLDYGICLDENGEPTPQLVELQGFPSLYFYQDFLAQMYMKHFEMPHRFSVHINGLKRTEYVDMLYNEIVGDVDPVQVVLLEVEPEKQSTRIDFYCAEKLLGIKVLCISLLIKRGVELFYKNEKGQEVKILKIYNRVIFDELNRRTDIKREFYFNDEVDVEWVGHPNWFFRVSKYTMPLLPGKYVPATFHLEKLEEYPRDLEGYVLKPLYSFAGAGVQLHVTRALLDSIADKENYILQKKVVYHPIIETMDIPAKFEIRMMAIYNKKEARTQIVNNLVRITKGEMVGVKYNKDKEWVGASIAFFENEEQ